MYFTAFYKGPEGIQALIIENTTDFMQSVSHLPVVEILAHPYALSMVNGLRMHENWQEIFASKAEVPTGTIAKRLQEISDLLEDHELRKKYVVNAPDLDFPLAFFDEDNLDYKSLLAPTVFTYPLEEVPGSPEWRARLE